MGVHRNMYVINKGQFYFGIMGSWGFITLLKTYTQTKNFMVVVTFTLTHEMGNLSILCNGVS